jgi:hypothetical protein
MAELMQASRNWMSRPDEERFTSLPAMLKASEDRRGRSLERVIPNRKIEARPVEGDKAALALVVNGVPTLPSHWAFGQMAALVGAPASYLRTLPPEMTADCLNYGLLKQRQVQEVGTLSIVDGDSPAELAAATGPNYGRIWNDDVIRALIARFGDGVTGDFTVPGEFGKAVEVSKANTTLFRSDRDMFVFLADEQNRIEIPNRRAGRGGSLARGFFVYNSEVGASSLGMKTFLFDYVCCNRIVWGATDVATFNIRHTSGAPHRFVEEMAPAIELYAQAATNSIVDAITAAQAKRIGDQDDVDAFLRRRFTAGQVKAIKLAHEVEEARPIETIFDAVTGATAYAKGLKHQDSRVGLEETAGKMLDLVR